MINIAAMYISPLYDFLFYAAIMSGTIPLLIIWKHNNKFDKKNPIYPYIVAVFVASLYEFFGTDLLKINSTYWLLVYKTLAITTLQYYFYHILNKKYKALFITFSVIFIATFGYYLSHFNDKGVLEFNGYLNAIITTLVIVSSILWFKQFEWKTIHSDTKLDPNLYFLAGLLIVYSGTLFLHLYSSNLYSNNKDLFFTFWMLNIFLNIVNRTLLIVGVCKIIKLHKTKTISLE